MFKALHDLLAGISPMTDAGKHPLLPHSYWSEGGDAPHPWGTYPFSARFKLPGYTGYNTLEFFYCLPAFKTRGALLLTGGGGLITNQTSMKRVLSEAQQYALRHYQHQTRAAILSWQRQAMEAGKSLPTRTDPVPPPPAVGADFPIAAIWDQDTQPQPEAVSFQAWFNWPENGSREPIEFRCYLPLGGTMPVVGVNDGSTGYESEQERIEIITTARKLAWARFNKPIRDAMARYWAAHELERFSASFRDAVEADSRRVVTEIAAGRQAQLADWLARMKPAPEVLSALGAGCWPTELQRQQLERAKDQAQKAVAEANKAVERAEADAQLALAMAKRDIEFAQEQANNEARKQRRSGVIYLDDTAGAHGITFGTPIEDCDDVVIPVDKIQHMLVGGVPGSGKTVFLHSLIVQLLRSPDVDQVVLIDMKRIEFALYDDHPKARVYTEIESVAAALDGIIELLEARKAQLATQRRRMWSGPRVFVVIDEHAMINAHIAEAKATGQKALAVRLANSLRQIVLTARSLGVVLICALQKPTSDAIDSNLKANMGFRCCFRLKTRQAIDAVLDYTDDLPIDPRNLRTGRFLLDDGRGDCIRLQSHVPPDLDLSSGW
ncbi:DNA segregation ATPase, FtsK/SpoIIIE family [Bradyrhizobium sp. YR681]|uniref:FtsK/SpoIIIE domain-containing protein n=1 Tax=Bradyrhizobium sp. YR681 TaxID=1144344 RepID=UPI000270EE34|nr:FtsK/SpoIIIE domain-containing protein [Bradyrhizobium sp. YR681]EJN16308.1 DNA segregation ATPase, FtsK/SpoIIIE family [Bradyrhizobium sp. YR681]